MSEAAFEEGREAGLGGANDADNPHPIGSDEAMSWEDGRSEGESIRTGPRRG